VPPAKSTAAEMAPAETAAGEVMAAAKSAAPAKKVSNIRPTTQPPIPPSAVVFAPPSVVPSPSGISHYHLES
jgi:hypothetical protein